MCFGVIVVVIDSFTKSKIDKYYWELLIVGYKIPLGVSQNLAATVISINSVQWQLFDSDDNNCNPAATDVVVIDIFTNNIMRITLYLFLKHFSVNLLCDDTLKQVHHVYLINLLN